MAINRQLKIDLLKDENEYSRNIQRILSELSQIDAKVSLFSIERAIASRILIKKLWDALPNEQDSYHYNDIDEQTIKAKEYLPTVDLTENVSLHLGWDVLGFTCSMEAAWYTWKNFNTLSTDTFNCCIYPQHLEWYIIRAGNSLYPMILSGEKYVLKNKQGSL
jgi:hypothetical protein